MTIIASPSRTWFFIFAIILSSLMNSCSKNNFPDERQNSFLNYTGTNPFLSKIVDDLHSVPISGLNNLSSSSKVSWDRYRLTRAIGDTTSYLLVPVLAGSTTPLNYLRVKLSAANAVIEADLRSPSNSGGLSGYEKLRSDGEKRIMGINVQDETARLNSPMTFSTSANTTQITKGVVDNKTTNTTVEENVCSTTIVGWYVYEEGSPIENALSYLNFALRRELAATGFPFTIGPSGIGIVIGGPEGLAGLVPSIWSSIVQETNSVYPNAFTLDGLDFQEACSNDEPPVAPQGPGPTPCSDKIRVRTLATTPKFLTIASEIQMKLNNSPNEWGASVTTNNGVISTTPVITNDNPDFVTLPTTWNVNDGFVIGYIHSHPSGNAPSQYDIFDLMTQLPNLQNSVGDANFYKQNAFVTIVTQETNYTVTVKDWTKLGELFTEHQLNAFAFDQHISDLTTSSTDMNAILSVFGDAVNMFMTYDTQTDYLPITLNTNTAQVTEIPCQ